MQFRLSVYLSVVGSALIAGAAASDRAALVIANTNYDGQKIAAPQIQAPRMEAGLKAKGFAVETHSNLGYKEMESEIGSFLSAIPTNGTGVLYLSGLSQTYRSGQQQKREIIIHGVDKAKDHKEARKFGIGITRFFERIDRECGARHLFIILDVPAENPLEPENKAPTAEDLADLEVPARTSIHLRVADATKEITALPEQGFAFLESQSAKVGSKAGQRWVNDAGMVFSWCPAGKFKMGCAGSPDAEPVEVEISNGFWISTYEWTQRDYKRIRNRDAPSEVLRRHPNAPVTHFGNGAPGYAKTLTEKEREAGRLPDGWEYRVPTEAEWEYACRAGSTGRYGFGDSPSDLHKHANFADKNLLSVDPAFHYADAGQDDGFGRDIAPVGSFAPNAWGIHDMHGNVSEWCADSWTGEPLPGGKDPRTEREKAGERAVRGGAWCSPAEYLGSGFRSSYGISNNAEKVNWLGVRFVLKRVK